MELVEIAKIAVSAARYDIDIPYDYLIPTEFAEQVRPGMRVTVPFGAGNRLCEGMTLSVGRGEKVAGLKAILAALSTTGSETDTMEELLTFPGVGRKTANLLLGDVYGQPAVVADTHCIRISGRLGLTESKDPAIVEKDLRKVLDLSRSSDFCHRLVMFGREYCSARSPKCGKCPLKPFPDGFECIL